MNCRSLIPLLLSGVALTACNNPQVYDSSVTEMANIRLVVDWNDPNGAIDQPAAYTALLTDIASFSLSGNSQLLEQIPTGQTRLLVFNIPEAMSAHGSILTVSSGENGGLNDIGPLFTAATNVYVKPNTTTEIKVEMMERTKKLILQSPLRDDIASINVNLNAASKLDVEYNRLFEPAPVCRSLDRDESRGVFSGSVNILGITDTNFDIDFSITDTDGNQRKLRLAIPYDAVGDMHGLASPLSITLNMEAENYQAVIHSHAGQWQLQISEIEIDNNL